MNIVFQEARTPASVQPINIRFTMSAPTVCYCLVCTTSEVV